MNEQQQDQFGACLTREALQQLPVAEQRVEIAKDVIRMLNTKQLNAERCVYVGLSFDMERIWSKDPRARFSEVMHKKRENNEQLGSVCAIGAVFMSAVDKFGRLKARDVEEMVDDPGPEQLMDFLKPWFSIDQLRLMELAFEGKWWGFHDTREPDPRLYERARDFCDGLDPDAAMRKIMLNVIEHNGKFRP